MPKHSAYSPKSKSVTKAVVLKKTKTLPAVTSSKKGVRYAQ